MLLASLPIKERPPGAALYRADPGTAPEEPEAAPLSAARRLLKGERIDLNRAGWRELQALPGIGPKLARAIVAHRERRGPFRSVEQLVEVRGIGPKKLEAVRPLLVVSPGPSR